MSETDLDALEAARRRLSPETWDVYTSNSYRRIGAAGRYREILGGTTQPDGHPDLTRNAEWLNDLCDVVNGVRTLIAELRAARTPAQTQTFKDGFAAGLEAAATLKAKTVAHDDGCSVEFCDLVVYDGSRPGAVLAASRINAAIAHHIRALKEPS